VNSNPGSGSTGPARRALISRYRNDDEITAALAQIRSRPVAPDEASRIHTLSILDDLAEEMIGRRHLGVQALKTQLHEQRLRWLGPGGVASSGS
jgi:hypothetical protein